MKTKSSRRDNASQSGEMFFNRGIHSSQLIKLFEDELNDIFGQKKNLLKKFPK